jgi:catechol 2,3-dioxygenase-like lactoylglutathione lyase family enzyme
MSTFITHIATLEIPVSNLEQSIEWYIDILEVKVHFKGEHAAMLSFEATGVPTLYLVETSDDNKLSFKNTHTDIVHSVIDFYTADLNGLYNSLIGKNVWVTPLNIDPDHGFGGFGFKDPDGNLLSATNVLHKGQ